jgi:hypothetical protein
VIRHDLVEFKHHMAAMRRTKRQARRPREEKMSKTKSEADRVRTQPLAQQYRAIGPAAIVAALLAVKKRKPQQAAPKAA